MNLPNSNCPPPEVIAAMAEGKLARREIAPLLDHVEGCAACRTELQLASLTLEEEAQPRTWWRAAAAAVVLLALMPAAWMWYVHRSRSPIERLAALAPTSAREIEPRLSGGFGYAPYLGALRGTDATADAQHLKLDGAAGSAIEDAERNSSTDAQHAAGVAYVLIDKPKEAVDRLRNAAARAPRDAALWSDLGAAQFAAALQLESPSLLPAALASTDRALSIDPRNAVALFNRALVLERLGLIDQARSAWDRYLAVDVSSSWAGEARAHLNALPRTNSDLLFRRELPNIERNADAVVRRWREQSRAWGEAEFLGRWGGGDADALAVARLLGASLRQQSGESLLADAVAAIDRADPAVRATLAEAHAIYRRGRIAYSRRQPSAAEPDLRRAASLFARVGSPMAWMARYYAANTRFDQNDPAGARAELESLLAESERTRPAYLALGALIRWQLSLCHAADGDYDGALPLLTDAASALRRLDERNNLGFVESLLADTFSNVGRPQESWNARIRSFNALSRDGREDRLLVNLASAVAGERRAGNRDAALSLLAIELETARGAKDEVVLFDNLTRGAVLCTELGEFGEARRLVAEAAPIAPRITDPAVHALLSANLQLAHGAIALHDDPRAALVELAEARSAYGRMGQRALEIDSRLLRTRGAIAVGDSAEAAREAEGGIDLLQRFRVALSGGSFAKGVLDSGDELYEQAIRLSLDRGDVAKAFGYAELARVRMPEASTLPIGELQARLAASDATVVEIAVLSSETVVFTLDRSGLGAVRRRVTRQSVAELAQRNDAASATALYDLLVPHSLGRTLIIVPDPILDAVSFAALFDARSHQHLVQQVRIVRAESAASLRMPRQRAMPLRVVSVSLPTGSLAALSDSGDEVATVAGTYTNAVQLNATDSTFPAFVAAARDADVVHVSGHTQDDGNGGVAALDFAGANGTAPQRIAWRTIAASPLPRSQVVVLAACDSLRLPRVIASRAPSLGGAFLEAGAAEVIGTLEPIGDREARLLFQAIHRQLAKGATPADAVRDVQIQAMADVRASGWRSIAVLTREIPEERERGDDHESGSHYIRRYLHPRQTDSPRTASRRVLEPRSRRCLFHAGHRGERIERLSMGGRGHPAA
jgi:CHAT domain-containing protein